MADSRVRPPIGSNRSIAELDFLELVLPGRILGFMEQEKNAREPMRLLPLANCFRAKMGKGEDF